MINCVCFIFTFYQTTRAEGEQGETGEPGETGEQGETGELGKLEIKRKLKR